MNKLSQAMRWRDEVEAGEMIETRNYTKEYLIFEGGVTLKELNAVCDGANLYYALTGSSLRIGHSCGRLAPAFVWDERNMGHKLKGFFPNQATLALR